MSAEKNNPVDAAVLSFTDIDHARRTLVHGSLDISPLAALESRQNIFTTQDFCAPLYGLRHPDLLPHNAYMSFVRYAAHTDTLDQGRLCSLDAQDITLYREAELPRCAQEQAMPQRVLIATSIAPKRIEDQQRAITTWTVQGFSVISVNYPEEIEQLQQHFPHIPFVPTQRDSKAEIGKRRVYVDNILNALYAHGQDADVLGIVNADVGLYRMAPSTLCQICTSGHILISHRINLPSQKPHVVGYDAFFFLARPGATPLSCAAICWGNRGGIMPCHCSSCATAARSCRPVRPAAFILSTASTGRRKAGKDRGYFLPRPSSIRWKRDPYALFPTPLPMCFATH